MLEWKGFPALLVEREGEVLLLEMTTKEGTKRELLHKAS